ncbi:exported protein of unknown function (plasmid) [Cupriavidus taiwanensis]|uniref:Uncharacterized protein n=1 Tax=Cupriavidus taiwanensis TaxID=164546 RepID=A0A375HEZ5_9BURK|nr:exported protein of unknown function [Cupriavidus taiwanensis]SOZ74376.1 exported protein of unknown function [Cupriavidus taiwanensis]SPA11258.1 exported protein of unknown function [Cupriavidus taiwanensis]SPA57223.1 exported protein of unknown function [Cupriavidus taiwanensis]SPD48840.1 protein of unknown function [Cupriavidus taiwanensis]
MQKSGDQRMWLGCTLALYFSGPTIQSAPTTTTHLLLEPLTDNGSTRVLDAMLRWSCGMVITILKFRRSSQVEFPAKK